MLQTWADPTITNSGCVIAWCSWETRVKIWPGAFGVRRKKKHWLAPRWREEALRPELHFQIFLEQKIMHYFISIWITGEVAFNSFPFKRILGCQTSVQLENYILPKIIIVPVESETTSEELERYREQSTKYMGIFNYSLCARGTSYIAGER